MRGMCEVCKGTCVAVGDCDFSGVLKKWGFQNFLKLRKKMRILEIFENSREIESFNGICPASAGSGVNHRMGI